MALFFSEKSAKKPPKPTACLTLSIESLDYQGLGVAKHGGKTWFVQNALPGELVEVKVLEEKRQFGQAQAVKFLRKAANRQTPFCALYGKCGGCQMQHIPLALQRETKQATLIRRLQKLQAAPIVVEEMITGDDRAYRRRAKLSIAWQKNQLVMGFRQAQSDEIVPLSECAVLEPALAALLPELQHLLLNWSKPKSLGHIELVAADNGVAVLLRHIGEIAQKDREMLMNFAENAQIMLFVMCDKNAIEQWRGDTPFYEIDGLRLAFSIRDFIQVNCELNAKMVQTAVNWLDLHGSERVLDLFCGMGNFTLPIAKRAAKVVGVEGVEPMVNQAQENARSNDIRNAEFYQTDLDQPFIDKPWAAEPFDKVLLDPARNGAYFALEHLCNLALERIVYVSCNPATLVRDAEKLIARGYHIRQTAMIDMFPHTAHLESITLFVKNSKKLTACKEQI